PAAAAHPRARCTHRHLRRARGRRVPGQRPGRPRTRRHPARRPAGRAPTRHRRRNHGMTPAAQASGVQRTIEDAWERRATLTAEDTGDVVRHAVEAAIQGLESGELRVAEPGEDGWRVNEWLKKAVLLYFRANDMAVVEAQPAPYWDKVEA